MGRLEEELAVASQALVARARVEVRRLLDEVQVEREAGVREVEQRRAELAAEVAAMERVRVAQDSRVWLDVGGCRFETSVALLRSKPGTMLDAMFRSAKIEDTRPTPIIARACAHML